MLPAYAQQTSVPHLFVVIHTFINYGLLNKTMLQRYFTTLHLLYTFQENGTLHRNFHCNNKETDDAPLLVLDNQFCLTNVGQYVFLHRNKSDTNSMESNSSVHLMHEYNYKQLSKINTVCTYICIKRIPFLGAICMKIIQKRFIIYQF